MKPRWWSLRRGLGLTLVREVHYAMGALIDVQIYHKQPETGLRLIRQACQEARRLESLLSRHTPESELSHLNGHAGRGPISVAPELFDLLQTAQHWAQWSQGAFDPTVGTLLHLWRKAGSRGPAPADRCIQAALQASGWAKLRLIPPSMVELTKAGMQLDLGGIGKGYAVDRMGDILRQYGVRHALINFGESSLLAIGTMPDGRSWPIAVRGIDGAVSTDEIAIHDRAIGTSASFGQVFFVGGRPLSHVIDPRHGHPLKEPLAVTVVTPTATAGEALATALLVKLASGEGVSPLSQGICAYQMKNEEGLMSLGRTSGDATLCPVRL
jgi:FAD:protein FMN transferase